MLKIFTNFNALFSDLVFVLDSVLSYVLFFFLLNILALVNSLKKTSSVSLIFALLACPFCRVVCCFFFFIS